jgi:propionyl-CoA synthetase
MRYGEFHRRSLEERDSFWAEQARLIDWERPFDRVLDYRNPPFARWFVGGRTNLCHNAVDRHLTTQGGRPALIYVSTEVEQEQVYTFALRRGAANGRLPLALGVQQGDRVLIYMPMVPRAVWRLACVRIGAVHSVCSAASPASAWPAPSINRHRQCRCRQPQRLVMPYKPLLDEAIRLAQRSRLGC